MGGRFGKYGDAKRNAIIRRSRAVKIKTARAKLTRRRFKKEKRIRLQTTGDLKVSTDIKP